MTYKAYTVTLLCCLGATLTQSCLANPNAKSCIELATNAAGYYLSDVQEQYDEGKDDANLASENFAGDSFVKGTHDSSTKRGLVYFKFGKDSGGNYIVTGYLGTQCGAATNTKLLCYLKKAGANWTDSSSAPPVPVSGFYMECEICSGVKLDTAGNEAGAPAPVGFAESDVASVSQMLDSAITVANYHGVTMAQTATGWPTGDCNTVTV